MAEPRKITIIGDINSGKTWLWNSYCFKRLPKMYTQTIFDNHTTKVEHNGKQINISLFDTCGSDDYSELRKLIYPGSNLIIFCIAINNPTCVKGKYNSIEKWSVELKKYAHGINVLVVGTKKDIRNDPEEILKLVEQKLKPVKSRDLSNICKKLKAKGFIECSAKTGEEIEHVFQTAVKLSFSTK